MAKILDKDPDTYSKERDGFLRDLQTFHDVRGTPFRHTPKLNGHDVDLFLLYSLVTEQGGWIKVNSKNSWPDLFQPLDIPDRCVNGSIALKQLYLRYLDRWEKVHFLGEEADRGSDDDEESRHKRWSARSLHSTPLTYNYHQHNIAETAREYNHLSTDLYKPSDYERLALSLLSPLPNEQDFAINVCTLLSNDGKHTLKLEKHPRLLEYLLAHAGVYHHGSLRKLITSVYASVRKQNIAMFWKETLESEEFLDLTNEKLFAQSSKVLLNPPVSTDVPSTSIPVPPQELPPEESNTIDLSESDNELELFASDEILVVTNIPKGKGFKLKIAPSDSDLFNLKRNVGTRDYMGQRVLQVATILRNLSFFEENIPVLLQNSTFVRFCLLCACSRWNQLMNLGMEMLGNISADFLLKDLPNDKIGSSFLKIITKGLLTEDRNWCITALEVLNKLSQNEANEDILMRVLEENVYERVCSFLTIHDVMLLIYTLECLYSLSSLGERSCNYICGIYGVVDTLVSLVTVEGKSYGPKACIGMKLVETVTGGNVVTTSSTTTNSSVTTTTTINTSSTITTTTTVSIPTPSAPMATPVQTSNAPTPIKVLSTPSTPQRTVHIAPQRLVAITSNTSTVLTSASVATSAATQLQQKHAHQQAIQENEQYALSWLRGSYESNQKGKIEHQELYKQYINSCAKSGRRGVIAPLHFPRCVRNVFGSSVGPHPEKTSNPSEPQYYEGIKVREQPPVLNVQCSTTTTQVNPTTQLIGARRKPQPVSDSQIIVSVATESAIDNFPSSPSSPILKAKLSAPPKPREVASSSNKTDVMKSQVMTHPHLSQALLGSGCANVSSGSSANKEQSQSNTSLIKSLLANKVNDCMNPVSMRTDCQPVAQVAARQHQQRLLAQQNQQTVELKTVIKVETPKTIKINGARQLFTENEVADPVVSSTTQGLNSNKNKKEPPQPPPPLAPLSIQKQKTMIKIENEDSDSLGNNSLASSTGLGNIGIGGVSSTEDGDNSLTSFEGLLNGIPSVDNPMNEDSNSKDSIKNSSSIIMRKKPLMLADLLEKKVDKETPILNGIVGKELRIGDKGVDLVENHIDKILNIDSNESSKVYSVDIKSEESERPLKRPACDDIVESEPKKLLLASNNNLNGSVTADSPAPDSVSSSNGDESSVTASTAAAKLFADLAADILEDEEEELMQEGTPEIAPNVQPPIQQMYVDNNQQVLMTQQRQIIVSQPSNNQVMIPGGTQLKTQSGQTVIVQNSPQQRTTQMMQSNVGQILLSQGLQGQMQLVPSGQPGQYVIQTGGQGYVVAQPQTAVVHGQQQTVLVAQPQGSSTKTIIILQQNSNTPSHHQKVVVTPQGQQMVVTQLQRPPLQQPTLTNVSNSNVFKTSPANKLTTTLAPSNGVANSIIGDKKQEEQKKIVNNRFKPIRDLTTPFVCEWNDCQTVIKFKSANQVFMHVCATHIPDTTEELLCKWDRCDNMKRKRFSLMTHINDKHCHLEAMKASLIKRKQIQHTGKTEAPTPLQPSQHPGYAPDAALHAIKRHALEFVNPKELQDDNEGPVTKSIRLTASLILRNLVIYSSNCRRYLKHFEPHLANVALSNVESSRTIAQILYDMNDCANHR